MSTSLTCLSNPLVCSIFNSGQKFHSLCSSSAKIACLNIHDFIPLLYFSKLCNFIALIFLRGSGFDLFGTTIKYKIIKSKVFGSNIFQNYVIKSPWVFLREWVSTNVWRENKIQHELVFGQTRPAHLQCG